MMMKVFPRFSCTLALAAGLGLASCSPDDEVAPNQEGLAGTWRLVHRQCFCIPGPPPNEAALFTATNFTFFKNNQPVSSGTYSATSVKFCGTPATAPGLRLTDANLGPRDAIMTQRSDSLVLDYGGPCDAPVDTYLRVK